MKNQIRPRLTLDCAAAALLVFLSSCVSGPTADIQVPQPAALGPWTSLKVTSNSDDFHFAIVSDRTDSARPGVFDSAMTKLNLLRPDFVINIGDIIQGYTDDQALIETEWADVRQIVGQLKMPFLFVPGNHDYGELATAAAWLQRFGRPYYHFTYRNVLFLVLNGIHPGSHGATDGLDDAQFDYFQKVLAENPDVRWTFVFTHYPLWLMEKTGRWTDLEKLLATRPHTVFAGHYHNYTKYVRHGQSYIVLATTGGASRLRGDAFGEFDHLAWVSMTGSSPQIANLALDGIRDENIRDESLAKFVNGKAPVDPVNISPLYLHPPLAAEASVTVSLRNTFGRAYTFTASLAPTDFLTPTTSRLEKLVAPGATETLQLHFNVRTDRDLAAFKPLQAKFQWSFKLDHGPDLVFDGYRNIGLAVPGDRWTVNAVDMALDGYMVRQFPNGRNAIRRKPGYEPPLTLKAALPFPGPTGRYKVTLVGIPDSGGTSKLSLFAGGATVLTGTLDRPNVELSDVTVDKQEFVAQDVPLQHGQELRLEGVPESSAVAFVEKIIFEPVAAPPAAEK